MSAASPHMPSLRPVLVLFDTCRMCRHQLWLSPAEGISTTMVRPLPALRLQLSVVTPNNVSEPLLLLPPAVAQPFHQPTRHQTSPAQSPCRAHCSMGTLGPPVLSWPLRWMDIGCHRLVTDLSPLAGTGYGQDRLDAQLHTWEV